MINTRHRQEFPRVFRPDGISPSSPVTVYPYGRIASARAAASSQPSAHSLELFGLGLGETVRNVVIDRSESVHFSAASSSARNSATAARSRSACTSSAWAATSASGRPCPSTAMWSLSATVPARCSRKLHAASVLNRLADQLTAARTTNAEVEMSPCYAAQEIHSVGQRGGRTGQTVPTVTPH